MYNINIHICKYMHTTHINNMCNLCTYMCKSLVFFLYGTNDMVIKRGIVLVLRYIVCWERIM